MMGIIGGLKVIADDNARLRIAGGPFLFFDKKQILSYNKMKEVKWMDYVNKKALIPLY